MVGYFKGLSSPSASGNEHQAQVLAQIVNGRTDQIADVLDKQEIQILQVPEIKRLLDHLSIQLADGAGGNLPHLRSQLWPPGRRRSQ
jgi:hypothetical protein